VGQYRSVLKCSLCNQMNRVDMVKINVAICGVCKTPLIHKNLSVKDEQHRCKKCGKTVKSKYRNTEETDYETFFLDYCDSCFLETESDNITQKSTKEIWKLTSILSTILSTLFVSVLGGSMVGLFFLDFASKYVADHRLALIYSSAAPTIIILILLVKFISKDFMKCKIEDEAKQQANNRLYEINHEHKEIQNRIYEHEESTKYKEKVKKSGIEVIDTMSGIEFEERLYHLFIDLGYKVSKTPVSGDQGADLIISKGKKTAAVQAKRYYQKRKVTNKAVQEALAGKYYYKTTDCWVVTNTFFTEPAKKLAKEAGITLVDRQKLINLLNKSEAQNKQN
jgi:restriction system protein